MEKKPDGTILLEKRDLLAREDNAESASSVITTSRHPIRETASAALATRLMRAVTIPLAGFYYKLTASIPRPLPRSEDEFLILKEIFKTHFHLKDEPAVWATVCGQLTSVPPTKLKKSYRSTVNAAKRLEINYIIQKQKLQAINDLTLQIKQDEQAKAKVQTSATLESELASEV